MRYFIPSSTAWWAGVFAIALGVLQAAGIPEAWGASESLTGVVRTLSKVIASLLGGDASPASLIVIGVGLIGIRDKLRRNEYEGVPVIWDEERATFEQDQDADEWDKPYDPNANLPEGESPFPDGVIDPYGPEGSR